MTDEKAQSKPKEHRGLEWLAAGVVGTFSGAIGLISSARLEYHRKLLDYINKTNLKKLQGELKEKEEKEAKPGLSEDAKKLLPFEEAGIVERIKLKTMIEQHAQGLEENTNTRLAKSFDKTVEQTAATEAYVKTSSTLKGEVSKGLNEFSKKLGIESEGFLGLTKGTWQRFNYMGKDTRRPLLINAAIATTVGAAGTMMFFNSLNTHKKLNQLVEHQKDDR